MATGQNQHQGRPVPTPAPAASPAPPAPVQSVTAGETVAVPKPAASITDDPAGPQFSKAWYRFLSNQFSAAFAQQGGGSGNSGSGGGSVPSAPFNPSSLQTQIYATQALAWLGPV